MKLNKNICWMLLLAMTMASSCKKTIIYENATTTPEKTYTGSHFLVAPTNTPVVQIFDYKGNLVKQKITEDIAYNFEEWNIEGKTYYTYGVHDANAYVINGAGYVPCYYVIADSGLNELKRVYLKSFNNLDISAQNALDVHDFILVSPDHYICEAYYEKDVTNIPTTLSPTGEGHMVTPVIQEVVGDAVVWQWIGADHPEFYTTSIAGGNFANPTAINDYMHLNSMYLDPRDGNLICSGRHIDQVFKLNRKTGDVIWRLGGNNSDFPITTDQQFLLQHHATLTDNNQTLLIYDNGSTARPTTRILEFQLDEANKKITGYKSFNVPEPYTLAMGSVQKHGTNYFIGGGTSGYVLDINYLTGVKNLEMTVASNYRALRYTNTTSN